jgi:error-prone DNA polymerase
MSRKRSKDAMRSHWEAFLEGSAAKGVDEETAKKVFTQVVGFSEFGFPKSHAAAFALLAYQSAWLRHYYPTEYYVALFNNQPMGFYSLDALGRDARRNRVHIRLPDVNLSATQCTAEAESLRVGLGFVRGWGAEIADQVVEERARRGPYPSLVEFLKRTPAALKRPAVENLIWVGGFDGFGLTRRELLWQLGLWIGPDDERSRAQGRSDDPQISSELDDPDAGRAFRDLDERGRIVAEYRLLRFSAETHPLALVRDRLPAQTISSGYLPELPEGSMVTLAGIVIARQRPQTAKGYVFVLMEDEHGHVNVIVKPSVYETYRAAVRMEPFLIVRGQLRKDGATLNVIAREIHALRPGPGTSPENADLPPTLEYWADARNKSSPPDESGRDDSARDDSFAYLTALRRSPPDVKSFG